MSMALPSNAFLLLASVALGQTPPDPHPAQQPESQAQGSAIDVTPGPPVIKQKDLWTGTGYLHPFARMPRYVLHDQKAIWTSPFHTSKSDAKYWVIFGAATAALVATDRHVMDRLPNSSSQVSISTWGSRFGASYTLIPISGAFYFIGTAAKQDRFRETGLLAFETLIDAALVSGVVKFAANRARPTESDGRGRFGDGPGGRLNSSFPSGHAISSWAMASIIAHEYPHPRIIPVIAYGLATTVVVSRVGARRHFPSDVIAGSAMGWFIGDFVYGRRHNRTLDQKPRAAQRILDHVSIGVQIR
jgi:membrane-associated phospholipid phosphatase